MRRLFALLTLALLFAAPPAWAGDPPDAVEVRLLDAGAEPRAPLRYRPVPGTVQTLVAEIAMETEQTIGGRTRSTPEAPGLIVRLDVHVDAVAETGDIACRIVVRRVGHLEPEHAGPSKVAELRESMSRVLGTTIHVTLDDRGVTKASRVAPPAYVPAALETMVDNMTRQVREMVFQQLPEEPVGLGATWTAVDSVRVVRWEVAQTTTYELAEWDEAGPRLAIRVTQVADDWRVTVPGLPRGATARVVSHRGEGQGTSRVDLRALAPLHMSLALDADVKLEVHLGGQTFEIDQGVGMTTTMKAGPPRAAEPTEALRPGAPPGATEAVAFVRDLLEAVGAVRSDALAGRFDVEGIVERTYGTALQALTDVQRAELVSVYETGLAQGGRWFAAWEGRLQAGELELEGIEAAEPRGDHLMVTATLASANPPGPALDVAWVFRRDADDVRIVDYFDEDGESPIDHAKALLAALGAKAGSPIEHACRSFGLPVPSGWGTNPPPLDVPVVAGAAEDRGSPDARTTLHVTRGGDVHYPLEDRVSPLKRVSFAAGDPSEQVVALEVLRGALQGAMASGGGNLQLLVRADAGARWHLVTWLLFMAWERGVRSLALEVRLPDGTRAVVPVTDLTSRYDYDRGPEGGERVKLFGRGRGAEAITKIRVTDDHRFVIPGHGAGDEVAREEGEVADVLAQVLAALKASVAEYGRRHWQVVTPEPFGRRVRVGDVVQVLQMLYALRVEKVEVVVATVPGREDPPDSERVEED